MKYLVLLIRWWFEWRIRNVRARVARQRARIAAELAPTWAHKKNIFQLGKLARRGHRTAEREHKRRLIVGNLIRA